MISVIPKPSDPTDQNSYRPISHIWYFEGIWNHHHRVTAFSSRVLRITEPPSLWFPISSFSKWFAGRGLIFLVGFTRRPRRDKSSLAQHFKCLSTEFITKVFWQNSQSRILLVFRVPEIKSPCQANYLSPGQWGPVPDISYKCWGSTRLQTSADSPSFIH